MALQGAGDPRWVVREREDGRNVNSWHWEDKDVSAWARDRLKQLLTPVICTASDAAVSVAVQSVDSVDGDATLYNRKGILKVLYDLKVAGKWASAHEEESDRTTGGFKFELFDEDPELLVTVDPKSRAEHACRALFADKVAPIIRAQCQVFIKELHAGAGHSLDGVAPPKRAAPDDTKVTDFLRSGMDKPQRPARTKASDAEALVLRDVFACAARDMYLALTDRPRLEAITRGAVLSEAREGGRFNLMNGAAKGTYTKLVEGEEVRMAWKLKSWGEDAAEGEVTVRIRTDEDGKTAVEVRIEGVPAGQKSMTEGFWRVQIFQAMKIVMGWGGAAQFL